MDQNTLYVLDRVFSEASPDSLKQLAESVPVPVKSLNNQKKVENRPVVTPKTKISHGR